MKRKIYLVLVVALAFLALASLGSCKPFVAVGIDLSENITSATTLAAGTYVVSDSFYVSAVLTLEPGVILNFASGTWIVVEAAGQIIANGTTDKHITFTSNAAAPVAGSWGYIAVSGGGSFTYCDFKYATEALDLNGANTTVNNCTFTSNTTGVNASGVGAGLTLTNNTFTSNGEPLYINEMNDLGATNSFVTNTNQRIYFPGSNIADTVTRTWSETDVPIYVNGSFYVSGTLILSPGVRLKMGSDVWIMVNSSGKLTADGTTTARISFSSAAASPAAGSWGYIMVDGGSSFKYCDFLHAGTALDLNAADTTVDNCTFTTNTNGVDASGIGASPVITNNVFTSNGEPLYINEQVNLGASNTFLLNTNQRIYYNGGNIAASTTRTWSETEVPTFINGSFYIDGTLVLTPGMTLKLNSGVWIVVATTGALTAPGTNTLLTLSHITFTSSVASPTAGSWGYITLNSAGSTFTYCDFLYATTALDEQLAGNTITNCTYTSCTNGYVIGY